MRVVMPDGKGSVALEDLPRPELFDNAVLCRMTHSLISTGTERSMLKAASGWPREEIREKDFRLGYCGAGVVEEARGEVGGLSPGDRVAVYGGPYVSHSEYVAVPRHLAHRIPERLDSADAAFMGLGAISMHGFRQGAAGLGEVALVEGTGLIGNLCAQMAILAGCRVVATDLRQERLNTLRESLGSEVEIVTTSPDEAEAAVEELSGGNGADAVYLCMGTDSAEPMKQAISLVRRGGKIVILGVLDVHMPREALFHKEAEVSVSRAAGPGRYDPHYERGGIDYPVQYARWTEGRNCAETLRLIGAGRLSVSTLIAKRYSIGEAPEAYTQILQGNLDGGVILEWD